MVSSADERDERLGRIIETYLAAVERGESVGIDDLIGRHPEYADDLKDCLGSLQFLRKAHESLPSPGTTIGDYRIERELGRGGMGIVYEAEQLSLSRRVALKVINANGFLEDSHVQRFQREAQATARLHHPNIVPVYNVGCACGHYFYAMQYIEGVALDCVVAELREICEKEKIGQRVELLVGSAISALLQPSGSADKNIDLGGSSAGIDGTTFTSSTSTSEHHRNVARVFADAADALDYAHREGILHRDVKPSNFLLDTSGGIWLIDFGLARTGDSSLTKTNDLLGTLRYMPPEANRGELTERSDLFGLGLTMYEVLAFRPAYDAMDRTALVQQVTSGEIRSIRAVVGVPRDLETIVMKLLRSEPSSRYRTGAEARDDLKRFIAGEPILARPTSSFERKWRWCKRNPITASLAVISCLLLLSIAIGSSFGLAFVTRQSNAIRRNLYAAQMIEASHAVRNVDGLRHVANLLDKWESANDLHGWEYYYLMSLLRRDACTLAEHDDVVYTVCWNHDGTQLLSASQDGTTKVWNVAERVTIRTYRDHGGAVRAAFWSPEGSKIASGGYDGTLVIRDWKRNRVISRFAHSSPINTICWNHDGTAIAAGYDDARVIVWSIDSGERTDLIGHESPIVRISWHPNGDTLASCAKHEARVSGTSFRLWDLSTASCQTFPEQEESGHVNSVYSVSFSEDGRLVTGGGDRQVIVWNEASQPIQRFECQDTLVYCVQWGDGNNLYSAGQDHIIEIWDSAGGKISQTLRGHQRAVRWIELSPDNRRLASASDDGTIKLWDLPPTPESLVMRDRRGFAWSSDSQRFASGRLKTQSFLIFDGLGNSLSEVFLPRTQRNLELALDWSQDGRKLAAIMDGVVSIVDARTMQILKRIETNQIEPSWIQWCSDNRRFLLLDSGSRMEMQIYDSHSGERLNTITGRSTGYSVSWSPCGKFIAGTSLIPPGQIARTNNLSRQPTGPVKVWDAETGIEVAALETQNASGIAWDPTGKLLATVEDDDTVALWNFADETRVCELQGRHGWIGAVAWSPDGTRLAVGGSAGSVKIWDIRSQLEVLNLDADSDTLVYLEWSPDGRKLAAWAWSGRVRIWDASEGYP